MQTTDSPASLSQRLIALLRRQATRAVGVAGVLLVGATASTHAATLRLMPIGDSITSGYLSTDNNGYRQALYNDLKGAGNQVDFVGSLRDGNAFDPDHEGHSGKRIDEVATFLTTALPAYQPNLVTLHIGTNDMLQSYQLSTAPNRLGAMIDQIFSALPGVTIVVAQLVPNNDGPTQSRINAYNSAIPGIVQTRANAGKHIYMVSMSSLTASDLADGTHPNDGGYQKMASVWNAGIQQVISKGWVTNIPFAGTYEIQCVVSGQVVDVDGGSTGNGAAILQYPYTSARNQLWNFIPTSGGYYQIKSANSGSDIAVQYAATNQGAPVVQFQFGGANNDQWRPAQNSDGTYSFYNRNSGQVLDVPLNLAQQQKTQLDQWPGNSGSNQKFNLISR